MIATSTSLPHNDPCKLSEFGLRDSKFARPNDDELTDEKPSPFQRTNLKHIADFFAEHYDERELMYLAGALEDRAYKKREASK